MVHKSDEEQLEVLDQEETAAVRVAHGVDKVDEEEVGTVVATDGNYKLLFPRPSKDPNDPLNWPRPVKMASMITLSVYACLSNINSVCFTPAFTQIAAEFNVTTQEASFIVSFGVLMLGVGNLLWVPFMRKFGKRPMFITACSIVVITNIASPFATSYGGLLAVRIISNFAAGSADATVPAFVADVFFLHERGACMMIFHIGLSCAFFIGPIIAGWITVGGGWRWVVGFLGIALFANLIAMVFLLRESSYIRDYTNNGPFEKRTYSQWLGLSLGHRPEVNMFKDLISIVRLVVYPPLVWVGFLIGIVAGENVLQQLVCTTKFLRPPYSFSPGIIGTFQIAGFFGAMIGYFAGGRLIDYLAIVNTRRHNGVREPEMRLPALLIPGICGPIGAIIMGLCFNSNTHWIGPAFGLALIGVSITCVNNIGVTYAVDSYHSIAGEVITVVFVIRNTIGCLLALFSGTWVTNVGIEQTFGTVAAIVAFFFIVGFFVYYFGKRMRLFTATYGPLKDMHKH